MLFTTICSDNAELLGGGMSQGEDFLHSQPALQHMHKRMA
jgi:hypothetical protein